MLRVEMLCTGDEVLHGQIIDTNAAWLADYLFQQGLPMTSRMTVGDDLDALVTAITQRSQIADILIVNGGLGPTSDDLSALAAATAAGEGLVEHAEWLARMEAFFAERGRVMAPSNRKQAQIPASAEMVDNPVGTACGFALQLNKCLMFFTPGVPSEFKVMVDQQIMPRLRERFAVADAPLCLRLTTFGRSESDLASQLDGMALPPGVVLGYRSSMPIIELKLTGPAAQQENMEQLWETVRTVAGENTIFEGTEGLPAQLARRLAERDMTLAVSEHFTAGLLNWQLQSANTPLAGGELLANVDDTNLSGLAYYARHLAERQGASLALVVSNRNDAELSLALHTPEGSFAQTIQFNVQRYSLKTHQEVVAMLAMNMLRRWLNGWSVYGGHGWITVLKTL
ncbi:nicotinamide mononucleotide deamidase-related protein YfaY [Pectobacterium brasiliense]|uniref:nicotinamide mononucleotide deamidase-related protein YfaY n=1 Tax=Pectobacterium brasiliense TaxID=180957 RepID=UPI001CE0F489|nr:nicotinamide mononucleotide deamidase-related protein YfaY [Pectobacterium brasiliense]MCA5918112.1 nicotinamide mononucleotide deamidase-related protein YfaY [Pectobacterium brasiliense]MCA5928712.1 nicotinamide mononucleotide deamidase-related protein YfaY [Pectobacterium brasiliense]MCA5933975.1 nicotinamide mononucleotide deamidase-related protein YfaY [Pectobacterium brasiliense]MCA5938158.1 nicotinamide mononucleotide deamidase-related protein YfaY [Pectobacterium brasiliense]MCA59452